jgi:hypothetical protein
MTEDQRLKNNEKAKERMRRFRERKKGTAKSATKKKLETRSSAAIAQERREKHAAYKRKYRAKLSAQKKRAIRKKDVEYHRRKKAETAKQAEMKHSKRQKETRKHLNSQKSSADDIERLIESSTPTTSRHLCSKNIFKKSTRKALVDSIKTVAQSAKKEVISILRKTPPCNKSGLAKVAGIRRATLSYKPKGRKNVNRKLFPSHIEVIHQFYKSLEISTQFPNKRKSVSNEPYYVMQVSILHAYKEFRLQYPNIRIGIFAFQKN